MVCEFLSIRSKLIDTSFVCGGDDDGGGGRGVDDADGISSSPDDDDAENGTRESSWFLRVCEC